VAKLALVFKVGQAAGLEGVLVFEVAAEELAADGRGSFFEGGGLFLEGGRHLGVGALVVGHHATTACCGWSARSRSASACRAAGLGRSL